MDIKRVNAAVKLKIQVDRNIIRLEALNEKTHKLKSDMVRLCNGMSFEELTEFRKRV